MTKFLKITGIVLLSIIIIFTALFFTFLSITRDAVLDENKLLSVEQNIVIYDENGEEIANTSLSTKRKSVKLEDLQPHTVNAFIASEDRTFYSHKGLNYKRMLKAAYRNIISHSFKEGASTISQQLIKNTHLTGDKTIKRKLKEIRLTRKLEKNYNKDQILEMYLNTIYFGHNCYGLQSAAEFYFDKKAENLTLDESAVLVGLLVSPNNYSPFKNAEKSIARRNIVLKSMLTCGFINEKQYKEACALPLTAVKKIDTSANSDYITAVFDELENVDLNLYDLNKGCKIYTSLQPELQNFIENLEYPCDNSVIITQNSGEVKAYKSTIGGVKRQPGSTIKPLAVYAPAIEERIVSPYTRILDEKINYNGYSPENYDGKYHGYVTVADSLSKSYNVPAVKTLNSLTIEKAEKYLNRMNIQLEDGEKNLSLALGGMEHGLTIKQIADCYTQFANSGVYSSSHFINKITTKGGKTVYEYKKAATRTFSEGCASLINQMLLETSKSGTAKKLRNFSFDIASKTGTCGNDRGNTDAYSVGYTSEHSFAVWLGDKEYKQLNVTGGNQCCELSKQIIEKLYSSHSPQKIEVDKGTKSIDIDAELYYENNKIELADKLSPKLNVLTVKTLAGNISLNTSSRFSNPTINQPKIKIENNTVNIELCQTKYYSYLIERTKNGKNEVIFDDKWENKITDNPSEGVYTYTVTPYYFDGNKKHFGQKITLPTVNISKGGKTPQVKIPEIINKDWFNY
ncbi:MAG: transglycosylase domain-containing protein [Clostridiales bacterium]|nr:transglycosylase domain-containing protein [Clostridiales bacterium]